MAIRLFIPSFIKSRFSFETKFAVKRMLEDIGPSMSFALSSSKQRQAIDDCNRCRSIKDYIEFTRKYLGQGSIQRLFEIEGAIEYLRPEAPKVACEIGTDYGGTNFLLGRALPSLELLVGIDLFIKHKPYLRKLKSPGQQLRFLQGSSQTTKMVHRLERVLNGTKLDVLFIDGDHRYQGVKNDFLLFRHLVRENGFVLFHDVVPDHRTRYGRHTGTWTGGVPLFWRRLKQYYPHCEFIEHPDQDGLGIGVVRYSVDVELPASFVNSVGDGSD